MFRKLCSALSGYFSEQLGAAGRPRCNPLQKKIIKRGHTAIIGSLVLTLCVATAPVVCAQIVITFDNLADSTVVTTQYLSVGVTFSGAVVLTCGQSLNCPAFPPFSFPNVIYDGLGGLITATFDPSIAGSVSKVSARVTGNRNITMTAYDAAGNVLATTATGGPNYAPVGSPNLLLTVDSSAAPIARVTFHDSGNTYTVDDFTFEAGFRIIQPTEKVQFSLTESSHTATTPVTFEAGPIAASASVQWVAQLDYTTSGGRGTFQKVQSFTTDNTTKTHSETYTSTGGKLTVQAKQNSPAVSAGPVTAYIVGTAIPDSDITSRLVSLYAGATPNLMTGIAMRESTYLQFVTRSLFGVSALWPTESYDGGSHIGLMQVGTTQVDAWDWSANTADAVNLFATSKMPTAVRLMNLIIAGHKGLRQLTAVELEHMAVCLYGEGAMPKLSQQYYAPVATASGGWVWAVNNSGNPKGVAYTDYVFDHRR